MPDLDWYRDVLPNRDRFPDATQWTLEDGNTLSLGQLRAHYASVQQLNQARYNALLQEKAETDRRLAQQFSSAPEPPTSGAAANPEEWYATDPVLAPVYKQGKTALEKVGALEGSITKMQQMLESMQHWPGQMATVLKTQELQSRNKDIPIAKVLETATTLQQRAGVPGGLLEEAYTLTTLEQRLAAERAAGEAAGRAAAQAEYAAQATAPFQPWGPASAMVPGTAPTFENDNQMLQAAYSDPDIQRVWQGDIMTLPLQ